MHIKQGGTLMTKLHKYPNRNNNPMLILFKSIFVWTLVTWGLTAIVMLLAFHSEMITPKSDVQFAGLIAWALIAYILLEKRWHNSTAIIKGLCAITVFSVIVVALSSVGVI